MDDARFQEMVSRLESSSAAHPRAYNLRVALLALLGFALMAGLLGAAGLGLLLIAGAVAALVWQGGAAWLVLAKLAKLLWWLAIPLWLLVQQSAKALFVRLPPPEGQPLTREQAPALFAAIDGMRRRLRGPTVHQVLVVDQVNAAVVQRPLFGLMGFPRNHLLLGLPLLESLSPDEALAVLGHEYGHLAGAHGRFDAFIYRLRNTWATIAAVAARWQGWFGQRLGRVVAWYAPYFNAYTFVLARANEYQADACAADLVGAPAVAQALKRADLAGPHYAQFMNHTLEAIDSLPRPPNDLPQRWAEAATTAAPDQARRWLDSALDQPASVGDTHPSLRQRLAALGLADDVNQVPEPLAGPSAAQAWLGPQLPVMRALAQARWAAQVGPAWTERHQHIQAQRARLAELQAQAPQDAEQACERLKLVHQLHPEQDQRAELAEFNTRHPGHGGGLWLEAQARLREGSALEGAAGLAVLEQLMALDTDAIQPGCEVAHAWCQAHEQPEQAEAYAQRWRDRQAALDERGEQAATLDTGHALLPAQLSVDQHAAVLALLQGLNRRGIAALYLARRVLPADPHWPSHVLGVKLRTWARLGQQQQDIVNRLAALAWPLPLLVCCVEGELADYGQRLAGVADARLL